MLKDAAGLGGSGLDRMLRVLLVTHSLDISGAPIALLRLVRGLADQFRFTVLTMGGAGSQLAPSFQELGVPVVTSAAAREFDIAICNTILTSRQAISLSRFIPVIWWLHEDKLGLRLIGEGHVDTRAFAAAKAIVVPSRRQAEITYRGWTDGAQIHVFENGIPDPGVTASPPAGPLKLINIGVANAQKGQDVSIHAMARLPAGMAELTILGRPCDWLYAQIKAANVSTVTVAGEVAPEEVPGWIARHHALVHPSREDSQAMVVVEAMAQGRAVLTSDLPGILEYVNHGRNGLVSPVGDPDVLAGNIMMVAQWPQLRERLGKAARLTYESRFSLSRITESFARLIENTAGP